MPDNKILVSIIIPYFKKKLFILKTINSVLNQSHKNLEIIIIYDDSDLSDLKFLKNFCKKKKRIKIYLNKKDVSSIIKKMLYGYKEGKKREVFPGYWIEKKPLIILLNDLEKHGKKIN